MSSYLSPELMAKKVGQFQSSSQQQRSSQQRSQDTVGNQDMYHLTASFGMGEYQQGGLKNYFKGQQEDLYYRTQQQQDKNQDQPRQMMNIQNKLEIRQDDINQREYVYTNEHEQEEQEQDMEQHQAQNELHFNSQEYNEDTLHQLQYQSANSNNQSQKQSQQNWQRQQQMNQQEYNKREVQQPESRIHSYLQQMVDNTQSIRNTEEQIHNYMSLPTVMSPAPPDQEEHTSSQYLRNHSIQEQDIQREPLLPSPEIQPSSQLSYSEIAFLKQKQQQASQERLKETKQKKILNEIAHFYRQLAENKKQLGEDNNTQVNRSNHASPIRKSESLRRIQKKNQNNISIERKQSPSIVPKQILQHSKSGAQISKQNNDNLLLNDKGNSKIVQENTFKKKDFRQNHSKSVQYFNTKQNNSQSQEDNSEKSHPNQTENNIPKKNIRYQAQDINRGGIKRNINNKQMNSHHQSLQLLKAPVQLNNDKSEQREVKQEQGITNITNGSQKRQIEQNDEMNMPLTYLLDLTPIQFQTFESKVKRQDYNLLKMSIINQYKQFEVNVKYSNEKQNYLSSVAEALERSGIKCAFRFNLREELQIVRKISKKNVLEGIKEVIELSDSYETITQDILVVESGKNSKRSSRTTAQQEKDDQTIAILKDMQMRIAQKIFFVFLKKVSISYKRQIKTQLAQFEEARNQLRLQLALSVIRHYSTIRSFKNQLQSITRKEIQMKRMKLIFNAIKAKGRKYTYYKPFVNAIKDNHRRILVQNALLSLFDYMWQQRAEKRKLNLTSQIYNSHLITKSYLILKAFCNRKKSSYNGQAMTAKNISLKYTTQLRQCLQQSKEDQYSSNFKWKLNSSVNYNQQDQQFIVADQILPSNYESDCQRLKQRNKHTTFENITQSNMRSSNQDLNNRDSTLNQQTAKYDTIKRNIFPDENLLNESEFNDASYDSKQFQKNFYCEEEFLSSARSLLETKRQITLDKLDKLKNMANQVEDQSSFLQKHKDKVQEQNRDNYEDSYERIIELQSDSKLNLVQIPQTSELQVVHKKERQFYQDYAINECDDSRQEEQQAECKSILTLEQHVKQIIRVLKKLSKKKESFKHKNPVELLLRKDAFFYTSDISSARNENGGTQMQGKSKVHPLKEHQEMIKRIEEGEKRQISSYLFYHWKIVFLERTLAAEISLLYSLKRSKKVLIAFKTRYRTNNEICTLNQQIREEKTKQNIFSEWFSMAAETSQRNIAALNIFYRKICFRRILYFSAYSKIKRVADNFYLTSRKKGVLKSWASVTKDNAEVRKREKLSIFRRYFTYWKTNISKIKFLRSFWKKILYSPDELLFQKYGNKKNLLKAILKSWRGIVLENENSMKQKLALKSAIQHRCVVQKTKMFFHWMKCVCMRKGLTKLFQSKIIKGAVSKRLLKPWRDAVANQKSAISTFRHKVNMNIQFKAFHSLKIRLLQNKVAKSYFLRRFFSLWKQLKEYKQEILPRNFHNRKLLKASFTSIMYFQLNVIRGRAKHEKSTRFFLFHIKKFMQTCMNLWQKYTQKRKSKVLLQKKLKKYADKNLKKRAFTSLKLCRVLARLKVVQKQKADEFRAVQYRKRYNLSRLLNDPQLNPQLHEILSILHYWKAFTSKQKNIKFIQSRIFKFHNRKILTNLFNKWQDLFNQRMSLRQQESSEQEDNNNQNYASNQNLKNTVKQNQLSSIISDKNKNTFYKPNYKNQNKANNSQSEFERKNEGYSLQNKILMQNQNNKMIQESKKHMNSFDRICHTFPSPNSAESSLPSSYRTQANVQSQKGEQHSPRFQSNLTRNSRSPSSKSNSPSQNKSTLKSNQSQDNFRKSRKSVRFELTPNQQQNYPTALTNHKLDYFDQKYNENEAFYQKLVSHKRINTSQL